MLQKIQKNKFILIGLILFFTLLNWKYIIYDPIISRDDPLLIKPLHNISSISEYINAVYNNTILDLQPIRDLTLYINVLLLENLNLSTFHLFNLILFIISILQFRKILYQLKFSDFAILSSILIYAFHPLMVSATGWISSRKHILALVFFLFFLSDLLKNRCLTKKGIFFYFLCLMSHQIYVLAPIGIYYFHKSYELNLKIKNYLIFVLVALLSFAAGTYKTFILHTGNNSYTTFSFFDNLTNYILSCGRSVILIFFPQSISATYYFGSIWNIIGIPILVIILFLSIKSKLFQKILPWLLISIGIHLLTAFTFINDTYLYFPLISMIITVNYWLFSYQVIKNALLKKIIPSIVILLLLTKTIFISQMWTNHLSLWSTSYKNEPSPFNGFLYGLFLVSEQNKSLHPTGMSLITWATENCSLIFHHGSLLTLAKLLNDINAEYDIKVDIMKKCDIQHENFRAYLGLLLIKGSIQQEVEGLNILKKIMKPEYLYNTSPEVQELIYRIKNVCRTQTEKEYVCNELKYPLNGKTLYEK
jgi:hypothetical protein